MNFRKAHSARRCCKPWLIARFVLHREEWLLAPRLTTVLRIARLDVEGTNNEKTGSGPPRSGREDGRLVRDGLLCMCRARRQCDYLLQGRVNRRPTGGNRVNHPGIYSFTSATIAWSVGVEACHFRMITGARFFAHFDFSSRC